MLHQDMKKKKLVKKSISDEQKKFKLFQKLTSHNVENFRSVQIKDFDLNVTENFEELQYIDDVVSPLIYCAHNGLKEICRLFLTHPLIDVDFETENNRQTPLIVACMSGNYEIMRLLTLANAEVNKPNCLNHTPLAVTLFRLMEEFNSFQNKKICFRMAEFLISHGSDVNWIIDKKKGYSLLHYFCSTRMKLNRVQKQLNYEIIKFLLQKGANPQLPALDDKTATDLLKYHCNREAVQNLIENEFQTAKRAMRQRIPKHEITKLGEGYFKAKSQP